jgi:hypothetical protein
VLTAWRKPMRTAQSMRRRVRLKSDFLGGRHHTKAAIDDKSAAANNQ